MANQLTGTIKKVFPKVSGTSKGGKQWEKQEFLLSFKDDDKDKELCLTCMKPDILKGFKLDQKVTVDYSVESREYNGKYYTNVNCFKIS